MDVDSDGILEFSHAPFDESNTSLVHAEGGEVIILRLTWDDWPLSNIDYNIYLLKDNNCLDDYKSIADVVARSEESAEIPQGPGVPFEFLQFTVPLPSFDRYCFVITKAETSSEINREITVFLGKWRQQFR